MTLSARSGVEFDPRIHDSAFLEEIDLYSELIIVAAASAGKSIAARRASTATMTSRATRVKAG